MFRIYALITALLWFMMVFVPIDWLAAQSEPSVDFARDVRPILSSTCFQCHGPDETQREADLRLDQREGLLGPEGRAGGVVVPGDLENSELIARITSDDPDARMPPADSGKRLSAEQISVLRRWVQQGAPWSGHWAFTAPRRPETPRPQQLGDWVAHPIDAFVALRLEQEGLQPSPPAESIELVRRVYLDLIGLPPSIEQADAFVNDQRDDRYRQLIEQLLQSPHYGEKWARGWLDAARYADSDGFEKDKPRFVWMYRDWVARALNEDLPYDQFIIQQIAGDLLPEPTQDQLIATGFLRNSMLNEEGGIDPEQFRMEAMFDRMDAIGKAVLGITIQCGQCHNHKYDPLTQVEYYRLFAFLNNCHEANVMVYPQDQLSQRQQVLGQIAEIERGLKERNPAWKDDLQRWMDSVRGGQPEWAVLEIENANDNSQRYYQRGDGSLIAQGYAPTRFDAQFTATSQLPEIRGFRLELMTDPNLPARGPGRAVNGMLALTEFWVEANVGDSQDKWKRVQLTDATADFANDRLQLGEKYADQQGKRGFTGPVSYAVDGDDETAWGIDAGPGQRNESRKAVFVTSENAAMGERTLLRFHLVQKHGGWNSDDNQNMNLGRFRISVTQQPDAKADPLPATVRQLVQSGRHVSEMCDEELGTLFTYWRTTVPAWSEENERIRQCWQRHPEGTTQLVLSERLQRRPTFRLTRGDFLKPADEVVPGTPAFLHPLDAGPDPTRLDFARWLADTNSPTTARSIVNRIWQSYFGTGLVETSEDLGSQSAAPTHPDLLDWLATGLMDNGWSLKWLHRQILMSATYRQSSRVSPELWERDPANQLLARGPRFRLQAELVRDSALAASGLLNRQIGGPGVYPPAPEFLFKPPTSYGPKSWPISEGSDRYRRALYTFRFRSVPYPVFSAFDAPPGDASCTRRSRSNTPLQALTTLNEPLFLECARALAVTTLEQASPDDRSRLTFAFRRCVTRVPAPQEVQILSDFLQSARQRFGCETGPEQAIALAAGTKAPNDVETTELAAWIATCRVILNLDENVTKE